jgi:hypothetical protein
MTLLTEREIAERREIIQDAIAMQRLEGLEPDPQTMAELDRAARGEIEIADVLNTLRRRIAAGEFHRVAQQRGSVGKPAEARRSRRARG